MLSTVYQTHKSQEFLDRDYNLKLKQYINEWKIVYGNNHHLYFDDDVNLFMKENYNYIYDAWFNLKLPVMKADIFRYAIIHKYGGIYSDADNQYLENFKYLDKYKDKELIVGLENECHICQWIFIAKKDCRMLKIALDLFLERSKNIDYSYQHIVHYITGPDLFTTAFLKYMEEQNINKKISEYYGFENNKVKVLEKNRFDRYISYHHYFGQKTDGWTHDRKKYITMNKLLIEVVNILVKHNIPYYVDCGSLLGLVRNKALLLHDSDVDLTIHLTYWQELKKINFDKFNLIITRIRECEKKGYILSVKFKDHNIYCDIYANPAFPKLEIINYNNKKYFIPINSDLYLKELYGEWRKPSKNHADWPNLFYNKLITGPYSEYWDIENFKIGFNTVNNNINKNFWINYYNNTKDDINSCSSFSEFVYNNYINKIENNNNLLLDLGAGNCRDSLFFASKNLNVIAVDYNGILQNNNFNNLKLIREDAEMYLINNNIKYNYIYNRWFLHSMPYEKSETIFKLAYNALSHNGLLFIELRSLNDENLKNKSIYNDKDKSYTTTHKRFLFTIEMLDELCFKNNFIKIYCDEGYFSPNNNTETKNPLLIRYICKKNN